MNEAQVRQRLQKLVAQVAEKAKADALSGESRVLDLLDSESACIALLDEKQFNKMIDDIKAATATKRGAANLLNVLLTAAQIIATLK